jgi:hypothetical protein
VTVYRLESAAAKQFGLRHLSHGNAVDGFQIASRGPRWGQNCILDEDKDCYHSHHNDRHYVFFH